MKPGHPGKLLILGLGQEIQVVILECLEVPDARECFRNKQPTATMKGVYVGDAGTA